MTGGLDAILELRDRVKSLEAAVSAEVRSACEAQGEVILSMQRAQLMEGKSSDGEDLRPYYTEDPYFKTPEAAQRYAGWKQRITPNPKRNRNAPNLYINGSFHSELGVEFQEEGFLVHGLTGRAQNIIGKYGVEKFGLTLENRERLIAPFRESIMDTIKKHLHGI